MRWKWPIRNFTYAVKILMLVCFAGSYKRAPFVRWINLNEWLINFPPLSYAIIQIKPSYFYWDYCNRCGVAYRLFLSRIQPACRFRHAAHLLAVSKLHVISRNTCLTPHPSPLPPHSTNPGEQHSTLRILSIRPNLHHNLFLHFSRLCEKFAPFRMLLSQCFFNFFVFMY